jgi:NAD(P)-dependent dehydrogenase (short-subunit alcohol dehydrogenase family)
MTSGRTLTTLAAAGAALVATRRILRARRAIDFGNRVVLILGGSRGLGLVLARELAVEGAYLALAARDPEELARAGESLRDDFGVEPLLITCDVTDRDQVRAAIAGTVAELGGIDVLINNAGLIQVGPLEHMTLPDFEAAMATHFWGPLYATLEALPHMRRSGARRIVNISSIGGRIAVPHLLPYSASKFALAGLSAGIRAELAREGFAVTTVCPGLMRTGSTYNALFKGQHQREFAWFHGSGSLPGLSIDAHRAARQILDACRHGDAELIITPAARLAVRLHGLAPGLTASLAALANRLLPGPDPQSGSRSWSGWQSVSILAPAVWTALGDRATAENNQIKARPAGPDVSSRPGVAGRRPA